MTLVRHLCANPGLSRADLSTAVGLTKSTVSLLVRELLDEGWLVERDVVATGDLGRRPTPLFIDPSRLLLLGAEVGVEAVHAVVVTLTGEVLSRVEVAFGANKTAKACMGVLAQTLLKLCKPLTPGQRIIGIGVGLPGGVDEASGVLRFAPNLGWRDLPVNELLAQRLEGSVLAGVPLFLQNEADVAALGELEFNGAQAGDPLLYLSINQGVGAGVIVGDRLLAGNRGFAGEVGHMVLQINGPQCTCGRKGCAEALIGLRAFSRHLDPSDEVHATVDEVQQELERGDAETRRAVKKSGTYLGVLLQNLASAYDPGSVVLGGACVQLGDALLAPALETLQSYADAANLPLPEVRISRFGLDAVAVGAAALARYRITRPLIAPVATLRATTDSKAA